MSNPYLPGYRLALAATALAFCVIFLGAFTRLVDAGLGCPDWPGCYGHILWPDTAAEVAAAEQAFPDAPVEHDKTWPEMVHRYFASSLGLVAIAFVYLAFRRPEPDLKPGSDSNKAAIKMPRKHSLLLLVVIICQGLFGMWTVTLKLWPQVVTAHLLGGFATLSLIWLLVLRLRNRPWHCDQQTQQTLQGFRTFAIVALLLVGVQIALGGWTTSNYAAVACPDLPTCQGAWLPPANFSEGFNITQGIGPNYLGGTMDNEARVAIHLAHRVGAIVVTVAVLWLCFSIFRRLRYARARQIAAITAAVLFCQLALGLANIVFHFPVMVAVAHNATGAVLLLCMVTLVYHLYTLKD